MIKALDELLPLLPNDQWKAVSSQEYCDIDGSFIGFLDIYRALAEILPYHYTVIDLGCGYNPQSFFFTDFKKYIAVDNSGSIRFHAPNTELVDSSIRNFIETRATEFNLSETFAICNFVPLNKEDELLIRSTFKNLYMFYPSGSMKDVLTSFEKKRIKYELL